MKRAGHDPLTADRAPAQPAGEGTQPGGATPRQTTATGDQRRPGTAWRRLRALHPVAGHLILLLCYLAAGVAVTWPRASYLAGQLPETRDSASYVWGFWWVAHQVSHLGNPWFTHYMAAPVGVSLGFHSLMVLPGLIFTPVTLLFGPSASYNLLVILVPGLSSYAMYRAARLWLRSQTGAIAAGAFFGLSAMLSQEDWYHINIAVGALFLPVTLELAVRLRRSPGVRQAVLLGIGLGAAVLTDSESAVLAGILALCVLLPWLLRPVLTRGDDPPGRRFAPIWSRLWPAVLAAGVTAVVSAPQLISMAQETVRGGLAINPTLLAVTDKLYGIGLDGMFAPSPRVAHFGLTGLAQPFIHSRNNENLPMFGVTLTALALFGVVVAWRRRNTWRLALLWVACCALALGGSLWVGKTQYVPFAQHWNGVTVSPVMPYTWFVRIPGLSSFREADRLAILGLVPAALLAGAAVDWMRYHARPLIVLVVALAVLESGYSGNPRVGVMPTALPRLDARIAADPSRSIVVDVPFGLRGGIPEAGGRFAAPALVLATADGHPRSIAYASRLPQPTINGMYRQAFYANLVHAQHYTPPARQAPLAPGAKLPLFNRIPASYTPLTAAQMAASRRSARRLDIGWVLLWYKNPALVQYLSQTGFRFSYRMDGVSVYQPVNR